MLYRCGHFLLVTLVRFNCARNSGVEHVSCPEGFDLNTEGLWALLRTLHELWMHLFWTSFFTKTTWQCCHVSWTFSQRPWHDVELWMESTTDGTSRSILWRWYDESAVTSSVSSSDSGATCRSQGAKFHPKPATCVTSSVSYPAPSTTHSFPSIHFAASHNFHSTYSTTNTSSVRTTSTSGTSIHTNWIQCILQPWRDDATDEAHSRIQYPGLCGQDPRSKHEPPSITFTSTNSSLHTL